VLTSGGCAWITRASVDTNGGDPNGYSNLPSISGDGRYVAFESAASDLVPGDGNGAEDVFVRDLQAGTTIRASVDTAGGDPDGWSELASISGNGRYVAFTSRAPDLVPGDGNGTWDVFVRDIQAGTTTRASIDTAGGDPNDASYPWSISADGRYVAFQSYASDLVPGDGNGESDVFVRDLQAGTTVRASVDTAGGDPDGQSSAPSISGDGRVIAFESAASDLVPGGYTGNVFVRDLQAGTTTPVDVDTADGDPDSGGVEPSISTDGRYVAFRSEASDLVPDDGNNTDDIFLRDLQAGTTVRASVDTAGGDPDGGSEDPSVNGDGRYVAFRSSASDLVPSDGNGVEDIFVRDLTSARTIRLSQDLIHREANGDLTFSPSISADGRFVAFSSYATNLVPGDRNGDEDVFVKYARVVTVTGISPNHVARGAANVTVTITGAGFEPGSVVQVHRKGSEDITLGNTTVVNNGQIMARLSIPADAPIGGWDVRVWHAVGSGYAVGQCSGCLQVT
jgi:Tol biopolymer transport system component